MVAVGAADAAVAVREGGGVPVVDDGVHGHGVDLDLDLATLRSARVGASSLTDGHRERTNEDEGESREQWARWRRRRDNSKSALMSSPPHCLLIRGCCYRHRVASPMTVVC